MSDSSCSLGNSTLVYLDEDLVFALNGSTFSKSGLYFLRILEDFLSPTPLLPPFGVIHWATDHSLVLSLTECPEYG